MTHVQLHSWLPIDEAGYRLSSCHSYSSPGRGRERGKERKIGEGGRREGEGGRKVNNTPYTCTNINLCFAF